MTRDTPDVDRRSALKTIGGLGAGTLLAGTGLIGFTGSAAANAELSVSVDGSSYSGDQGDLDWVGVDIEKVLFWDGFDVPLGYIGFKHEINVDANQEGWHVLYDQMSAHLTEWSSDGDGSDGWGGPGEYVASYTGDKEDGLEGEAHADVHWAIISDGSHPSEWDSVQNYVDWTPEMSEPDDGATNETEVTWRTTLTFYDDDKNQIAQEDGIPEVVGSDTFVVSVTNEDGNTTDSTEDGTSTTG